MTLFIAAITRDFENVFLLALAVMLFLLLAIALVCYLGGISPDIDLACDKAIVLPLLLPSLSRLILLILSLLGSFRLPG